MAPPLAPSTYCVQYPRVHSTSNLSTGRGGVVVCLCNNTVWLPNCSTCLFWYNYLLYFYMYVTFQLMGWINPHLWPAVIWWWTVRPIHRIPMHRDNSEANCLQQENCSSLGSGGRRKPVTSSKIFPKVGSMLISVSAKLYNCYIIVVFCTCVCVYLHEQMMCSSMPTSRLKLFYL